MPILITNLPGFRGIFTNQFPEKQIWDRALCAVYGGSEGIFGEVKKAGLGGGRNGRRHRVKRGPDVPPGSSVAWVWELTLFLSKMNIHEVLGG